MFAGRFPFPDSILYIFMRIKERNRKEEKTEWRPGRGYLKSEIRIRITFTTEVL